MATDYAVQLCLCRCHERKFVPIETTIYLPVMTVPLTKLIGPEKVSQIKFVPVMLLKIKSTVLCLIVPVQ